MTILKNAGLLKEQLLSLGFVNGLEQELLFRLCFLPPSFSIRTRMEFGADAVLFVMQFERSEPSGEYRCLYFEATLRKQVMIAEMAGVQAKDLVKLLESIPWTAFGEAEAIELEQAQEIEMAVSGLDKLSSTTEGKFLADTLRYKYWRDTSFEDRLAVPPGIRSRFEVRQHFYLFDGEAMITAKDAYLFLNNKWLEKQVLAKKKLADSPDETPVAKKKKK